MIIISIVILLLYLILIGVLVFGFDKVKAVELEDIPAKTDFSIVIPFRNESDHLMALSKSILGLAYPRSHFEVLFINDASEDHSVLLIESHFKNSNIDYKILDLQSTINSPKKEAISKAVEVSRFEWIITTDADCILPKFWLDCFDHYIQRHEVICIAGPVTYHSVDSFFKRFQLLDFLSLQGATIGGFGLGKPFMCNGANFAYKRSLYEDLDGFKGNLRIASGDDVFFLQKAVKAHKDGVHFLKNPKAIIKTAAQSNWNQLIAQRVRWAAKSSSYDSIFGKLCALIVFLMNGFLVCSPLLAAAQFITYKSLLYIVLIKFAIDFLLLFKSSRFFDQDRFLGSFLVSGFCYPFFAVYVAFLSIFKGYKWKGRSYSK